MKKLILTTAFALGSLSAMSQEAGPYKPIEELGWELTELYEPGNLTTEDVGEVKYLITLDRRGNVVSVKLLSNTFNDRTELLWRETVKEMKFSRINSALKLEEWSEGTLLITREPPKKEDPGTTDVVSDNY